MSKSIKFQLMRSIKSGKNRLLLIGFLVYIVGFCFFLNYKEKIYDESQKNILQYELQEYGPMVKIKSSEINGMDESAEGYDKLKLENEFYQSQYNSSMLTNNIIDRRVNGIDEVPKDNFDFIKAEKIKYVGIKESYARGVIDDKYLEERGLSLDKVDRQLNYINYLLENEIPGVINPYTLNGVNFIRNFFTGSNIIVVLIFILLFLIDSYVIELRDDCYKTIYTSPLKRTKLLLSKIISSYILTLLIVFIGILLGFLLVSLIFGLGQLSSPVQVNEGVNGLNLIVKNISQEYLPLSTVTVINFISFIVFLLFIVVLSISLSVYTSNDILSLGVMISLMIVTYCIHSIDSFININRLFNPFSYIFFEDLSKYELMTTNFYGVIMQLTLSVLILGLTTLRFKKKDLFGIKGE